METIILVRNYFKEKFTDVNLQNVICSLKDSINIDSTLYNELCLLQSQYAKLSRDQNKWGILSREEADLAYNKIHYGIIQLIDSIKKEDLNKIPTSFDEEELAKTFPKVTILEENVKKRGIILYRIPSVMTTKEDQKCIIRIAYYDEALGQESSVKDNNVNTEEIRIADTMKVSLSSTNQDSFSFTTLSERQYLEQQNYTEWVFYVRPKTSGTHKLLLQTSIYERIKSEIVSKDFMIAEKKITAFRKEIGEIGHKIGIEYEKQENEEASKEEGKSLISSLFKKSLPPVLASMVALGFVLSRKSFIIEAPFIAPLAPSPSYDYSLDIDPSSNPINPNIEANPKKTSTYQHKSTSRSSSLDNFVEAVKDVIGNFSAAGYLSMGGFLIAGLITAILLSLLTCNPTLNLSYDDQLYTDSLNITVNGDRPPFNLQIKNRNQLIPIDTSFLKNGSKNIAFKDLSIKNGDTTYFYVTDKGNFLVTFLNTHTDLFKTYLTKIDTLTQDTIFKPYVAVSYKPVLGTNSLKLIADGNHPPFNLYLKRGTNTSFFDTIQYTQPDSQIFDFNQLQIGRGDTISFYVQDRIGLKDTISLHSFVDIDYTRVGTDSLMLYFTGTHPPFKVTIKNDSQNQPFKTKKYNASGNDQFDLRAFLKEKEDSTLLTFYVENSIHLKDSFNFGYTDYEEIVTAIPSLDCSFNNNTKILTLTLNGGFSADQIFAKHNTTNKSITTFKRTNISPNKIRLDLKHPDFRSGETYIVEVIDTSSEGKIYQCEAIKIPKIVYPKACDFSMTCNFSKSTKKLHVNVQGTCPPFKIFVNDEQIASLQKSGDHYEAYPTNNRQILNIKVVNKVDKVQSCTKTIGDSCYVQPLVSPFKGYDCIDMDNLSDNSCAIVYLYRKNTRAHWKMKTQTFNNCELVRKIEEIGFNFHKMDIASMNANCSKNYFTQLGDVTTFIYRGHTNEIERIDNFISAAALLPYIKCRTIVDPPPPQIPAKVLGFIPKENQIYRYEGGLNASKLHVTLDNKSNFYVRILAEEKPKNSTGQEKKSEKFHGTLASLIKLKFKDPRPIIYVSQDRDYWYVYLGRNNLNKREDAEKLKEDLKKEESLKLNFLGERIKDIFVYPRK